MDEKWVFTHYFLLITPESPIVYGGEYVKAFLLKQQGFYTATVNGVFDNKTRSAVMKSQKAKGLKADGIVGRHTLAAMN